MVPLTENFLSAVCAVAIDEVIKRQIAMCFFRSIVADGLLDGITEKCFQNQPALSQAG